MKVFCFAFNILLILFSSCRQDFCFTKNEVKIILPNWKELENEYSFPALEYWKVMIFTEEGIKEKNIKEKDFFYGFKKNRPACVLAYPMCLNEQDCFVDFFKPCGSLLCMQKDKVLELKWESGFSAYVMASLFNKYYKKTRPYVLLRFNWKRFESEIQKLCVSDEGVFYNPWLLDLSAIVSNIAYNSFKVSLLKLKEVSEYNIPRQKIDFIISSYVPENKNILTKNLVTIKNQETNLFCNKDFLGVLIKKDSENNELIKLSSLPIFNIGYD